MPGAKGIILLCSCHNAQINAFRTRSRLNGLAHVTYNSCGVNTCKNLVTSSPYSSLLHIICVLCQISFFQIPFALHHTGEQLQL